MSLALGQRLGPTVGTGTIAAIGWVGGTALGTLAGSVLPLSVREALSVMLYGMFIAIVVPQARRDRAMLVNVGLALTLSCLFMWLPVLKSISAGLAIVICTVAAGAAGLAVGILLAFRNKSLIVVAGACSAAVFLTELLIALI